MFSYFGIIRVAYNFIAKLWQRMIAVWFCVYKTRPTLTGLSHTSFEVARISSLLAQVELVIIKLQGNRHFSEGKTIKVFSWCLMETGGILDPCLGVGVTP